MDAASGVERPSSLGGERQAVRVDSRDTHGNEEEHFLVISGHYRIAIGDQILDAPPGTCATVPRKTPHSWRNIAAEFGCDILGPQVADESRA